MTEDESRQDPKSPQDARLASLDERLRQAQAAEAERTGDREDRGIAGHNTPASRVLTVLVSYPLGSAMIGYALDQMAGTHGIWVAMLFVGFALAMWEVWKISQRPYDGQGK